MGAEQRTRLPLHVDGRKWKVMMAAHCAGGSHWEMETKMNMVASDFCWEDVSDGVRDFTLRSTHFIITKAGEQVPLPLSIFCAGNGSVIRSILLFVHAASKDHWTKVCVSLEERSDCISLATTKPQPRWRETWRKKQQMDHIKYKHGLSSIGFRPAPQKSANTTTYRAGTYIAPY